MEDAHEAEASDAGEGVPEEAGGGSDDNDDGARDNDAEVEPKVKLNKFAEKLKVKICSDAKNTSESGSVNSNGHNGAVSGGDNVEDDNVEGDNVEGDNVEGDNVEGDVDKRTKRSSRSRRYSRKRDKARWATTAIISWLVSERYCEEDCCARPHF